MQLVFTYSNRHLSVLQHCMGLDNSLPPSRVNDKYNVYQYPQYNMACCVVDVTSHQDQVHDIGQAHDVDKVIFVNGHPHPMVQYPDNYHFVTTLESFEHCLGVEFNTEKRNKLRSRFFEPPPQPITPGLALLRYLANMYTELPRQAQPRPWNKRLKEAEEGEDCCICMSKAATIMLAPCSHQCVCDECAPRFMQEKQECPLCREVVEDIWRPLKK